MQRLLRYSSLYCDFCDSSVFQATDLASIKEVKSLLKVRRSHRVAFFNCVRLGLISSRADAANFLLLIKLN